MGALAVVERWFEEVWNQNRRASIAALFAPDGTATGLGPEPARGPEGFYPFYDAWRAAFEDFRFELLEKLELGAWASVRVRGAFRHRASGRRLTAEGLVLARVEDGLIAEAHNGFDFGAILERAGVFPGGSLLEVLNNDRVFATREREERNKEVVRSVVAAIFNGKQHERVAEFYHPDCEGFDPALDRPLRGIEAIAEVLRSYEAGFPGYRYELHDLIAEGDKVAFRFTITGEHRGAFNGLKPTDARLTIAGQVLAELEDGKVRRIWQHWDSLGLAEKLGLIARPGARLL